MSDQDFDQWIDTAAGQLVSHRPSRQLKGAVMARIREPEPATPRGFVWATAAVAVLVCGVIAIALMTREVVPVNQKSVAHAPAVQEAGASQPAVEMPARPTVIGDQQRDAAPRDARVASAPARAGDAVTGPIRPPVQSPPEEDLSTIPPLETTPITLAVVEVPPLASETVLFEQIEIEPLAIEPLSAAND